MAHPTPLLTTKQLQAGFSVSDMTIWAWRTGTPTRSKLPTVKQGRAVLFKPAEIATWAKKHDLTFDLAAAQKVEAAKLGPKAVGAVKEKAEPTPRKTAPAVKQAAKAPAAKKATKVPPVAKKAPKAKAAA